MSLLDGLDVCVGDVDFDGESENVGLVLRLKDGDSLVVEDDVLEPVAV